MTLHHRSEGNPAAPVIVLSGSLGTTLEMWDAQVAALAPGFRVVRYDHPGHGRSALDGRSVGDLARVLLASLDELEIARFSFCGVSLGGAVGMRLALDVPERIDRLALLCTSARFGAPEPWQERADLVRAEGVEAVADTVLGRWFTPDFPDVRRYRAMLASTSAEGYARCCEALRDWDVRGELAAVRAPTLAVAATDDPATPPEHLELIAERVPGARLETVRGRHLAAVERADEVSALLIDHFR